MKASFCALVCAFFSVFSSDATPYASSLTNSGTAVSFVLNEPANKVLLVANAATNDLGALPAGLSRANFVVSGPFQVVVINDGAPGYIQGVVSQISSDTNALLRFPNGRGVTVNANPADPAFGRVYVANSNPGTTTNVIRSVGRGLYALRSDLIDALNFGTNAQAGSLTFAADPNSPYRLSMGEDGRVYLSDYSRGNGGLFSVDAELANGQVVLANPGAPFPVGNGQNHGRVAGAVVTGRASSSTLNAYWMDGDYQEIRDTTTRYQINSLWNLFIGNSVPTPNLPTKVYTTTFNGTDGIRMDVARGPDGKLYLSQYRIAGSEPIVFIIAPDNTYLTNTLDITRAVLNNPSANDLLAQGRAIDVSPNGQYLAVLRDDSQTYLVPLVNGLPDLTNRQLVDTSGGARTDSGTATFGDVAFDAAGNLYVLTANQTLRVFSPGSLSTAITSSTGAFSVTNQLAGAIVSVSATKPLASETSPQGSDNGTFTFTRSGDTSTNITVNFTLTGTAGNGTDYVTVTTNVTFASGVTSVPLTIIPIDDAIAETTETVILTINPGANYQRQSPFGATVFIRDNETPVIRLSATDTTTYERVALDAGTFTFTRLGATNADVTVNLTISGTALNGVDYGLMADGSPLPTSIVIPAGITTQTLSISPKNDSLLEGTETVILTVAAGAGYTPDTQKSGTVSIVDDDLPPAPILFQDNFDSDTSANWIVLYGDNARTTDYYLFHNFDYLNNSVDPSFPDLIPPSPLSTNSSAPRGVKMYVNKDATDAAGGINLYPRNQSFSGNFALRFSMFLDVGGGSSTEHAIFGINHSGALTNRFSISADPNKTTAGGDGIWFAVNNDNGVSAAQPAFAAFYTPIQSNAPVQITNRTVASQASLFPNPPYNVAAGVPGISRFLDTTNFTWVDVEVSQVGKIITLKLNNTTVLQFTNPSTYTNGNIMLGYVDPFDSTGSPDTFVVYDDVRVVALPPTINVTAGPAAAEPGTNTANSFFTITRTANTNTALTVNFALTGTAINGTDYVQVPASVTIPAGSFSATLSIVPKSDNLVEGNETVVVTLTPNPNYDLVGSTSPTATLTITDVVPVAPRFLSFSLSATNSSFSISGGVSDTTNQFVLESSPVVTGPYLADSNATVLLLSNGYYQIITTNQPGTNRFYRIKR